MRETYMDKPKLLYCCYLSGTTSCRSSSSSVRRWTRSAARTRPLRRHKVARSSRSSGKRSWKKVKNRRMRTGKTVGSNMGWCGLWMSYIYNIYIHYIRVRGTACVWSKKCTLFGCNSYMRDPWVLEGMVPLVLTLALNPHFSRRIFQYKVWKLATGRVLSLFWSNDSMKCACVLHRGLHGCRV